MATYNGERFVVEQMRSILAQLGPSDEVVVADDASTDRTVALIGALADPRVILMQQPTNRGVIPTFEAALRRVRGRFVFLADQDDLWLPGKVQTLMQALQARPSALLALSDARVIDESGQVVHGSFMDLRGGFRPGLGANLVRNRYLGCTMLLRRELLHRALPIPGAVPMHDIWLGWMAATVAQVVYVPQPLMLYRRHDANASPMRPQPLGRMLAWRVRLLTAVLGRMAALLRGGAQA